jgi:alpha-1,2-mannosyltransferase
VIWAAWGAVLISLALTWLSSARAAGRIDPTRASTGMFALSSIAMLAVTPICWHHYFLWTMPACLFLIHRPGIVAGYAALSLVGSSAQMARAVGWHMMLALGLFAMVAREIHRSTRATIEGRPDAAHPRA